MRFRQEQSRGALQTDEPRGHFSGGGRKEERLPPFAAAVDVERAIFHLKYCSARSRPNQEWRRWTDEDSLSSLVEILVAVLNGPNDNCEVEFQFI